MKDKYLFNIGKWRVYFCNYWDWEIREGWLAMGWLFLQKERYDTE